MPTVIITGANGNLGSAVTSEFLNKGYGVVATVVAESMRNDLLFSVECPLPTSKMLSLLICAR
jgi:NAD(P)-dependent dehydrogenase (short-subunit alcohol dehydrogenase family)